MVTEEELYDGARLVQQLDAADFPVTVAFWAYDSVLEIWRFIIAAPQNAIESRTTAYGVIQRILADNGLAIALDRVTLIPDDDPQINDLRAQAESDTQDVVEIPVGRAEIAGRVFDPILLYRSDALRYERDVIAALQGMQPPNAVMRSYGRLGLPFRQADAQIVTGDRLVIIEARAVSRLLAYKDVVQVEIMKTAYERYYDRPVTAIVISHTDFTTSAMDAARDSGIVLIHWTGSEDNDKIQRAIATALA